MNAYNVTVRLEDQRAFMKFLDVAGPFASQFITTVEAQPDAIGMPAAPSFHVKQGAKVGRKRGSKVNDTILATLKEGPKSVKELKEALERAGLSSGSLSTGLAYLQKVGQMTSVGGGSYALPRQQPSQQVAAE